MQMHVSEGNCYRMRFDENDIIHDPGDILQAARTQDHLPKKRVVKVKLCNRSCSEKVRRVFTWLNGPQPGQASL